MPTGCKAVSIEKAVACSQPVAKFVHLGELNLKRSPKGGLFKFYPLHWARYLAPEGRSSD